MTSHTKYYLVMKTYMYVCMCVYTLLNMYVCMCACTFACMLVAASSPKNHAWQRFVAQPLQAATLVNQQKCACRALGNLCIRGHIGAQTLNCRNRGNIESLCKYVCMHVCVCMQSLLLLFCLTLMKNPFKQKRK